MNVGAKAPRLEVPVAKVGAPGVKVRVRRARTDRGDGAVPKFVVVPMNGMAWDGAVNAMASTPARIDFFICFPRLLLSRTTPGTARISCRTGWPCATTTT